LEGIRRSHESVDRAELILHVLDGSEALTAEDCRYLDQFAGKKRVLVRNKVDQPQRLELPAGTAPALVAICALTGQGLEALKDAVQQLVWSGEIRAEMLPAMINARHQDALRRARAATERCLTAMREDLTLDLVAEDLRIAVNAVGEIVGQTATEDLLDAIFSQFCIGK
jgi:tRNA modification GTPase